MTVAPLKLSCLLGFPGNQNCFNGLRNVLTSLGSADFIRRRFRSSNSFYEYQKVEKLDLELVLRAARISREGKEDLHFARIKVQTSRQGAVVGPKWVEN